MKRVYLPLIVLLISLFAFSTVLYAHCQMPCGIYDDEMRINMINEHIATIEKAMNQINDLEKAGLTGHSNQLIRWVMTKDEHAVEIQEIVSQYFMAQRIKFDTKEYNEKLSVLHHMLVYAMKCKQTNDLKNVEALRNLVTEFKDLYFKK
jgi:nickel superoxide dismutase